MTVPRVVELYYKVSELALLLRFSESWVRERIQAGDFGECLDIDGDLRIPASGVNAFLAQKPYQYSPGVKARNRGELMRKLAKQKPPQA